MIEIVSEKGKKKTGTVAAPLTISYPRPHHVVHVVSLPLSCRPATVVFSSSSLPSAVCINVVIFVMVCIIVVAICAVVVAVRIAVVAICVVAIVVMGDGGQGMLSPSSLIIS